MSSKRRILLVDKDRNASYILSMILKLNDFDVDPYTDPKQALSSFSKGMHDLMLLDVEMPGMSGFELYRKIREIDGKAKVCFMTNNRRAYMDEFKRSFPDLPQSSFVDKPVTAADLLQILQPHLGE